MGSVYKTAGVDYSDLEAKLQAFSIDFKDISIPESIHSEAVQADAQYLLRKCDLPENTEVWEIQAENPMPLLILGETNRLLKKVACEGLMRATVYAKEHSISLGRMLMEACPSS